MTDRSDHRHAPRSGHTEPLPTGGVPPDARADAVAATATDGGAKRGA